VETREWPGDEVERPFVLSCIDEQAARRLGKPLHREQNLLVLGGISTAQKMNPQGMAGAKLSGLIGVCALMSQ
jgi:hypothetical protein